jgi:hypothetical protein
VAENEYSCPLFTAFAFHAGNWEHNDYRRKRKHGITMGMSTFSGKGGFKMRRAAASKPGNRADGSITWPQPSERGYFRQLLLDIGKEKLLYAMLLPGLLFFVLFKYLPRCLASLLHFRTISRSRAFCTANGSA